MIKERVRDGGSWLVLAAEPCSLPLVFNVLPATAVSPGDLGDWLMMEPGAAAPTDLCPFLLPWSVGLDTGVSRAIWGDCRVEEAEQSWQCGWRQMRDMELSLRGQNCPW